MIMNQFKRAQVVILPTENKNIIYFDNSSVLNIGFNIQRRKPDISQHLYIISDEEIKEGNWYYNSLYNEIRQCCNKEKYQTENYINNPIEKSRNHKIIATTDILLNKTTIIQKGNQGTISCKEGLPQPSQQFIEKYIESYNKGEVIIDVLVEYEEYSDIHDTSFKEEGYTGGISPIKSIIKINPKDNTITIKKVKDSWNREEIIKLIKLFANNYQYASNDIGYNKWINENI